MANRFEQVDEVVGDAVTIVLLSAPTDNGRRSSAPRARTNL